MTRRRVADGRDDDQPGSGIATDSRRATLFAVAAGLAASALLAVNVASTLARPFPQVLPDGYRYWEDLRVAAARAFPASSSSGTERPIQRRVEDALIRGGIRPWHFWAVIPVEAWMEARAPRDRAFEDFGRSQLVAVGFRALGGVAPWLLPWLAPLLCMPVLVWTGVEMARAGWPAAGPAFALLWAASAFVVDALPLAYSAIGFYLVGALLVVPWSAALLAPRPPGPRGLLVRAAAVSFVLSLCVYCRSGSLLLLPGFLLALALGVRRGAVRRPVAGGALVLILALPLAARTGGGHDVWITLWEGLGDFDREKGHVWSDAAAKRFVRAAGVADLRDPAAQPVFRGRVLGAIREDPGWYATILAKRLAAVLTQWKLLPRGRVRPAAAEAEGATDGYYTLTRTVDVLVLGRHSVELPLPVLWLGPVLLVLRPRAANTGAATVPACLLIATLGVPVLVSTAAALETQAAALPWLLAWGFVLQWAIDAWRRRSPRGSVRS